MPRSLENLFDSHEPDKDTTAAKEGHGAFDELLDGGSVDTRGAIDASWEKVGAEAATRAGRAPAQAPEPEPDLGGEDEDVDALLGIGAPSARPVVQPAPSATAGKGLGIPWWVPIAAALLALAGMAVVLLS